MREQRLKELPAELFDMAVMLYQQGGEASLRSATTRSYYAVLSLARVVFDRPLDKGNHVHREFPKWIKAAISDEATASRLVDQAEKLYNSRIAADYNLAKPFAPERAAQSLQLAELLFNALAAYGNERA